MDINRIKIESEILSFFKGNDATVHFDFEEKWVGMDFAPKNRLFQKRESVIILNLITYNPIHGQHFLYHSVEGTEEQDCLAVMLEYVKLHKDGGLKTWTIEWKYKDEGDKVISYFSGKNLKEAMEKFYFDKDEETLVVYQTRLNPIS